MFDVEAPNVVENHQIFRFSGREWWQPVIFNSLLGFSVEIGCLRRSLGISRFFAYVWRFELCNTVDVYLFGCCPKRKRMTVPNDNI